jgi:hypothetical protein
VVFLTTSIFIGSRARHPDEAKADEVPGAARLYAGSGRCLGQGLPTTVFLCNFLHLDNPSMWAQSLRQQGRASGTASNRA